MPFALSVTPTAGTGTISVAAGSGAVTGVGTNFSGQALLGRIIIVGRVNFLVTAVASNTAMTISPAPVQDIVGQTFTFVANGTQINQTGTDTSLAGLAPLPGVLALTIGQQTVYKLGMIKLAQPTTGASLTFNANSEGLAWHAEITAPEVITGAGRTITMTGARTDGTFTGNFYPRALALPRNGSEFLPQATPIDVSTGTLNATGVWFDANTTVQFTGTVNITDCKWTNTGKTCNFRLNSTAINVNGLALHGANLTLIANPASLNGVKFFNSTYVPVSLPSTTEAAPRVHSDWDFQGVLPLFNNFGGNPNFTEFVNLANWDGFRVATNTVLNMALKFTKQVSFLVKDGAGANLQDCVVYRLDTNNGNRTFYAANEHTILTTAANGTASGKILAQVGRLPANYIANSTVYTAVMDFRNAANNGTGDDVVYFASYGHLLSSRQINTKGNGTLAVEQTVFTDTNVTLSRANAIAKLASSFTVNPTTRVVTVTANSTYDDIYDALKAYKVTANATNLATPTLNGTIVTPSGTSLLAFANWTLVVNNGVTLSTGIKFDFVRFDTITINGTGQITGVYETNVGTSTVWEFQNVAVGSSLVIYNSAGTTLYFRGQVTSAGTYAYYIPPGVTGTYTWAIERYGFQRQSGTFAANTGGLLFYVPIYIDDIGLSVTNQATVAAYTSLETASKFFDYTAFFRLSEQGIKLGQIATRSGTAIEIGNFSHLINKDAAAVYSITGTTITTRSTSYAGDSKYNTEIANPPRTITANTNEVITINLEDANGNSSVTIQASGNNEFEIWKITNATNPDDYATGTLLDTVGIGVYRFIAAPGFKMVIRDTTTNFRVVSPMEKGNYEAALFFGAAVQLAQAPEVTQINTKVDILQNAVDALPTTILTSEVETGATVVESLRLQNAVLGAKVSGAGTGTEVFRDLADTKDRLISTVDANGNRTAEVSDLT